MLINKIGMLAYFPNPVQFAPGETEKKKGLGWPFRHFPFREISLDLIGEL